MGAGTVALARLGWCECQARVAVPLCMQVLVCVTDNHGCTPTACRLCAGECWPSGHRV